MAIRLIINGKKAQSPEIRDAITLLRKQGYAIEVRVTWEGGDVQRLITEAYQQGWNCPEKKLIIGGGDGSVQEVASALMRLEDAERPSIGILPLGTANDFATACQIPLSAYEAIKLALDTTPSFVDIISVYDLISKENSYCMNILTTGFGAQVTAETPVELKNFLGGGAYTLTGIIQALNFTAYQGQISTAEKKFNGGFIIGAICNGKQAGGGQVLGPDAYINDGLLDVLLIKDFPSNALSQVIKEISAFINGERINGDYIDTWKTTWLEAKSEYYIPTNLDGEPHRFNHVRIEVLKNKIPMLLPENCPCLC